MRIFTLVGILLFASPFWVVAGSDTQGHELQPLYVTAGTSLNLRSGPGTKFEVITSILCGREVFKIEGAEGWVHISLHKIDRDSTAWVSEKFVSTTKKDCPKLYSCHDCGRKTVNPPGVFDYSMCDRCMSAVNAEAINKIQQVESGQDFTCEFCGAYAPDGHGMCNSCLKEYAKILGGG